MEGLKTVLYLAGKFHKRLSHILLTVNTEYVQPSSYTVLRLSQSLPRNRTASLKSLSFHSRVSKQDRMSTILLAGLLYVSMYTRDPPFQCSIIYGAIFTYTHICACTFLFLPRKTVTCTESWRRSVNN